MTMAKRVMVHGRSYHACAVCQRALTRGYGIILIVQEVGAPPVDPVAGSKQALCRDHYFDQFKTAYPGETPPTLEDNLLTLDSVKPLIEELESLTHNQRGDIDVMGSDPALLDRATQQAEAGQWAESVRQAYDRLSEINAPDVEMLMTPSQPEDNAPQNAEMVNAIKRQNALLEAKLAAELGCSVDELWEKIGVEAEIEEKTETVQAGLTEEEMDAIQIVSTPSRLERLTSEEQASIRAVANRVMERMKETT